MGLDAAMCYCGSMACASELAWVSSGTQRDSALREALYAQRALQISTGYLRANPLEDVFFIFTMPSFPDYPIFSGEL